MIPRQDVYSTLALAACLGLCASCAFGDPASPTPTPPPAPATPVPPALQAQEDAFGTRVAAAVNDRDFGEYQKAVNTFVFPSGTFVDLNGVIISSPKYVNAMKTALPTRSPGVTETIQSLSTTVSGDTAVETGVVTDGEDAFDKAGKFGPKGAKHHLETRTSFRAHWAQTPAAGSGATIMPARLSRDAPWKIQVVAFTDVQYFVDGNPYFPPHPAARRSANRSKPASQKRKPAARKRNNQAPFWYVIR